MYKKKSIAYFVFLSKKDNLGQKEQNKSNLAFTLPSREILLICPDYNL